MRDEFYVGQAQFAAAQSLAEQQLAGRCEKITGVNENGDAVHGVMLRFESLTRATAPLSRKREKGRASLEVEERPQLFAARRVTQFAQRLGLDLADAFAG